MAKRLDANSPAKDVSIVELNINNIDEAVALPVKSVDSKIVQPVDIQNRLSMTVQTHSAVVVGANGNSTQTSWMDTDGFDRIAVTLLNDGAITSYVSVLWSNDGVNIQGADNIIASATGTYRAGSTDTKARYAKVQLVNGDTTTPHTMNAWAYLKA